MPEARESFPQLELLDPIALNARYCELRDIPKHEPDANGFPCACGKCQTDEHLIEMISILGILRRKSAGPPKAKGTRPKTIVPAPSTALDLL
jgi:hypothetical protein